MTFLLFSLGIIGTGLLAVPVLAGSAAYALAEALKWPIGLERKPEKAKGFYGTLSAATLLGVALSFTSIDPIKALFWSAGRLVKHTRWLLLAEGHLTRRLFGSMLSRIAMLSAPAG